MNKRIFFTTIAASCFTVALGATPANAQATRTFVSGTGSDANPCSRTAPCQTFAGAFTKTATGGEINCLDPGGFGTLSITKSITIDCVGTMGSALASGTTGFTINGAGIVVTLRNININGGTSVTPGINGIRYLLGARLNVENVTIFNFTAASPNGFGILINPTAGTNRIFIHNTVIRNNGTAVSGGGIRIAPTGSANVQVQLENVELTNNRRGIDADTAGTTAGNALTISNSRIFASADNALNANSGANSLAIMIAGSTVSNNLGGVILNGTGVNTRIGGSTVTHNGIAFSAAGGSILQSYRNNQIDHNGNNGTPLTQAALN